MDTTTWPLVGRAYREAMINKEAKESIRRYGHCQSVHLEHSQAKLQQGFIYSPSTISQGFAISVTQYGYICFISSILLGLTILKTLPTCTKQVLQ